MDGYRLSGGGDGEESSKIRPETKVVELVEHYKSRLGQFLDPGLCWLAKRKILSETRVFSAKNSGYLVNHCTDCLKSETAVTGSKNHPRIIPNHHYSEKWLTLRKVADAQKKVADSGLTSHGISNKQTNKKQNKKVADSHI